MNETAYYYPAPYWVFEESDWVKSLLLFFDDIAILLPNYMHGRTNASIFRCFELFSLPPLHLPMHHGD